MEPQNYPTPEDFTKIEARAHKLRAQATADAFAALKAWVRAHLPHRNAQKA